MFSGVVKVVTYYEVMLEILTDTSCFVFFFKQKTAYEIGTGDWSSDVCSSDLQRPIKFCYLTIKSRCNGGRNPSPISGF